MTPIAAKHLRLVPPTQAPGPPDRQIPRTINQLSAEDLEVAERLADVHSELAAQLPTDSQLRGVVLRAGGHWASLGRLPGPLMQLGSLVAE